MPLQRDMLPLRSRGGLSRHAVRAMTMTPEEAAEIVAELMPIGGTGRVCEALTLYVRAIEGTRRARPLSEYHEDMGPVLWWKFPIEEPPYVGSPLDLGQTVEVSVRAYRVDKLMRCQVGGWPGYHTHWTYLPFVPEE
jgi:hypothetical protein